jgi:hypothetical protein
LSGALDAREDMSERGGGAVHEMLHRIDAGLANAELSCSQATACTCGKHKRL